MKILAYAVRPDEESSFTQFAAALGHEVTLRREMFGPETAGLAEGYEGISILGNCRATAPALEMIAGFGIRYLASRSAGINNIDLEAARRLGIHVSNVPAYSPNAVAEFAVAATLALARNLPQVMKRVSVQNFGLKGLIGFELRRKTIGVIGTGRIGLTAIKAFSGFGARLIGYDLYQNEAAKPYIEYKESLADLFREADIITLHTPLTADNYHLINAGSIAQMKDGVLIINTARGGLMDAEAVIAGLKSGKIGGLAADVYENEIGIFHQDHTGEILTDDLLARLLQFPNVLLTPHCGFYTDEAVANMVEYALQSLQEFERTGHARNEVQPALG